jgi:hypothetical protein
MRPSSARIIARLAEGGTERNALGRSRGGFSTKINARTNAEGLPIGVVITPGQAHDVTAFPALMQEIDCDPEQMLGDRAYDSEAVRNEIEERGGKAAIPSTATRKVQHAVDKALYSFAAFVLLACIRIWIKFVHATSMLTSRTLPRSSLKAPCCIVRTIHRVLRPMGTSPVSEAPLFCQGLFINWD